MSTGSRCGTAKATRCDSASDLRNDLAIVPRGPVETEAKAPPDGRRPTDLPDAPTDPVRELLTARDLPETFVVYQSGGYGIEPITYILGPDAPAVADVVRVLL